MQKEFKLSDVKSSEILILKFQSNLDNKNELQQSCVRVSTYKLHNFT